MDAHRADAVTSTTAERAARALGLGQGAFYLASGLWPLVHGSSFVAVTGPKVDFWLVQTVGALLVVSGAGFGLAALRRRLTAELRFIAAGQAAVLALIDVAFVTRGRIAPIYLADAVVEVVIVAAWVWLSWQGRHGV